MKIHDKNNNVFDAVDAVVENGIAAIEGTTTPAVAYAEKVITCLSAYPDIAPIVGYENVPNAGYLYFVYDRNRFDFREAKSFVTQIDAANPFD